MARSGQRRPDGGLPSGCGPARHRRVPSEAVDLGQDPRPRRVEIAGTAPTGTFYVVPRREGWTSRLAESQPGHLEYWLRRHQILPTSHRGIEVEIRRPAQAIVEALSASSTRIAAGGFIDGVGPDWNRSSMFRCRRLGDAQKRWESMATVLEEAAIEKAAVLVLPELTVDSNLAR